MSYRFFGWNNCDVSPVVHEYPGIGSPLGLYDALSRLWCEETCAPRMRKDWSEENRTLGQCSITAFLVQDIFGGEVYGVDLKDGNYHCFNVVDSHIFDLTSEQFAERLDYSLSYPQKREKKKKKEEKYQRYLLLKKKLKEYCIQKDTD